MAIQLYRKGTTHTVNGIECELQNFTLASYAQAMKSGWVVSPKEIKDDAPKKEKKIELEENKKETKEQLNQTREDAKNLGIDGWETRRLKSLQKEIDEKLS